MTSFGSFVEIEMIGAIKLIYAIQNVLAGMRMNNVKKNSQTQAVGCINKLFQVFRCSISGAGGEKAGNLVPKSWILLTFSKIEGNNDVHA